MTDKIKREKCGRSGGKEGVGGMILFCVSTSKERGREKIK